MTRPSVILAADGALDVAAARRLTGYGDLADADVARALEQVHMQRWGRADLPGHLRRIDGLAAVIVDRGRVHVLDAAGAEGESERLDALFTAWPAIACDLIDWRGQARDWLIARAAAHDRAVPRGLARATGRALAARLAPAAPDHPADPAEIEAECRDLFDRPMPDPAAPAERLIACAAGRARLWWRAEHARGALATTTRAHLVAALG